MEIKPLKNDTKIRFGLSVKILEQKIHKNFDFQTLKIPNTKTGHFREAKTRMKLWAQAIFSLNFRERLNDKVSLIGISKKPSFLV